jgi:hypothetical protein
MGGIPSRRCQGEPNRRTYLKLFAAIVCPTDMQRKVVVVLAFLFLTACGGAVDTTAVRDAWRATESYEGSFNLDRVRAMRSYISGRRQANVDLKRGCLRVKTWGLPMPSRLISAELYEKRLGVSLCVVGGCVATASDAAERMGYNEVMLAAIENRYGKGIPEKIDQDAMRIHEERRKRGELPWQVIKNDGRVIPPNDYMRRKD